MSFYLDEQLEHASDLLAEADEAESRGDLARAQLLVSRANTATLMGLAKAVGSFIENYWDAQR